MISTASRALRHLAASSSRPPGIPSLINGSKASLAIPGCSRWMTCTCCRSNRTAFFSSNPRDRNEDPVAGVDQAVRNGRQKPSESRLPLPPRLPYSPKSLPFQRHLQILSLSTVSSTPAESWSIYLALDPSLHRYIPDDIYRALISHQLSEKYIKERWERIQELIKFGQSCGMDLGSLGVETLEKAVDTGFGRVLAYPDERGLALEIWDTIRVLWETIVRLRGGLAKTHVGIRRNWLRYSKSRLQDSRRSIEMDSGPVRLVQELIRDGGWKDLEASMGSLLTTAIRQGETAAREAISTIAWCWDQGIEIPDKYAQMLLLRLGPGPTLELHESSETTRERLLDLCEQTPAQRAERLLSDLQPPRNCIPKLVRIGLKLLRDSQPDMDLVIRICRYIKNTRNADGEYLFILTAVTMAKTDCPDEIIVRFATEFASISTNSAFLRCVFESLLRVSTPEAYPLARNAYAGARASEPPYRWSKYHLWHKLFRLAIDPNTRHLQFASRLYADLLADGLQPHWKDMLDLIRTVGMSKNASRPILLERYIKDYLEFYPARQSDLAEAVVSGLAHHRGSDDALLALSLAKRLSPITGGMALRIVQALALARGQRDRNAMLALIQEVAGTVDAITAGKLYATAITSVILHSGSEGALEQDQALSLALNLSQQLANLDIALNAQALSVIIRGLLDTQRLHNALGLFNAVINSGGRLKSGAVGRLMIHLAMANRIPEAEEVERKWRDSFKGVADVYDRGVVGARVLLDVKLGREIDLEEVAERTGWKGTAPFLAFLRGLQSEADSRVEMTEEDEKSIPDLGVKETIGQISLPVPSNERINRRPQTRRRESTDTDSSYRIRLAHG